jgi:hypothetical protein
MVAELEHTLNEYVEVYNHHIPQRNLGYLTSAGFEKLATKTP